MTVRCKRMVVVGFCDWRVSTHLKCIATQLRGEESEQGTARSSPRVLFMTPFIFNAAYFASVSAGDSSLLFGEISGSALAGIEAALSRFLKPLLSESDGWGKADTEQKVTATVHA